MTLKNTDSKYIIKVTNKQTVDNQTDTITETAYGSFYEKNGKQYILYKTESEGDRTSVIIRIDRDFVSIKRSGAVETSMEYRIGAGRRFLYRMPYGTIEMELETQKILSDLTENGGRIELVYTLSIQGEKYFNNTEITVDKR